MQDELVAAAQALLADGRGLDAVMELLLAADLGTIARIQVVRAVTGVGLQEAVGLVEAAKSGEVLAHLTAARIELMARAGHTGGWWGRMYADAVLANRPWLTLVPGSRSAGLGSLSFWQCTSPPHGDTASDGGGSLSGPSVEFAGFVAQLRALVADDPLWRTHVTIVQDEATRLTCRFELGS